ncbi:MAG: FAD-dependent oxidoreductase [Firmicutes bacterium]|nr:FAD-dependent oxidoreductase [Bacillota bacterium]
MGIRKMFILMMVVLLVVALAGCGGTNDPNNNDDSEALTTDVLVIGGGAAGLAAAIEAVEAGASVILLEKLPALGGSTVISGGIMYAAESPVQERAGVEENWQDLAAYWIEMAEGDVDEDLINYIAENSGETIAWLEGLGVEFSENLSAQGISPALRGHVSAANGGLGLIGPTGDVASEKGVEIMLNTAATSLIIDEDGRVTGAEAEGENGELFTITAGSVVLATGGFDKSVEMLEEYAPVAAGHISYVSPGNVGDGLRMAVEAGADVVAKNGVIGFRGVAADYPYSRPLGGLVFMPSLYVDEDGNRFMNEANHYAIMYEKMVETGGDDFYSIFDKNSPVVGTLEDSLDTGYVSKADSFEDLAEAIGVPVDAFMATVDRFNELAAAGNDEDFGNAAIAPLEDGEVYALSVSPATLGTFGGPRINLAGEVLNTAGEAIQGLYAVGEVANGQLYKTIYPASGTSITMSFTLGRVTGAEAAAAAASLQ